MMKALILKQGQDVDLVWVFDREGGGGAGRGRAGRGQIPGIFGYVPSPRFTPSSRAVRQNANWPSVTLSDSRPCPGNSAYFLYRDRDDGVNTTVFNQQPKCVSYTQLYWCDIKYYTITALLYQSLHSTDPLSLLLAYHTSYPTSNYHQLSL